jgi:phosphate:Na+ symporter
MVWFINVIVKVVEKMVPMKADDDDEFHLEYMGTNLLRTAELSL